MRSAAGGTGSGSWVLLGDIQSFTCRWLSARRLRLELTVPGVKRDQDLQAEAWWPRGFDV